MSMFVVWLAWYVGCLPCLGNSVLFCNVCQLAGSPAVKQTKE